VRLEDERIATEQKIERKLQIVAREVSRLAPPPLPY
jgi:hypothetical protein